MIFFEDEYAKKRASFYKNATIAKQKKESENYRTGNCIQAFSKDVSAIAAYNGGIGSVTRWKSTLKYDDTDEFVEQIPYPETRNYVKKVLRTYWMYGNIY